MIGAADYDEIDTAVLTFGQARCLAESIRIQIDGLDIASLAHVSDAVAGLETLCKLASGRLEMAFPRPRKNTSGSSSVASGDLEAVSSAAGRAVGLMVLLDLVADDLRDNVVASAVRTLSSEAESLSEQLKAIASGLRPSRYTWETSP